MQAFTCCHYGKIRCEKFYLQNADGCTLFISLNSFSAKKRFVIAIENSVIHSAEFSCDHPCATKQILQTICGDEFVDQVF